MPVILSDDTWTRIEKMLMDYESGVLRVIPGKGLKFEEQVTVKSNCPGTKLGVDPSSTNTAGSSFVLNVSDGTNTVTDVGRMNFIGSLFSITEGSPINGLNTAEIALQTEECP